MDAEPWPLEDWQQTYLEEVVPLPGLDVEQSRPVISWFAFAPGNDMPEDIHAPLATGSTEERRLRMFAIGMQTGLAIAASTRDHHHHGGRDAAAGGALPRARSEPRNAVQRLRGGAPRPGERLQLHESALLRAIQDKAEKDPSAEDLHMLTGTYATLCSLYRPSPGVAEE